MYADDSPGRFWPAKFIATTAPSAVIPPALGADRVHWPLRHRRPPGPQYEFGDPSLSMLFVLAVYTYTLSVMVPTALPKLPFSLPVTSTLSPSGDTANAELMLPPGRRGMRVMPEPCTYRNALRWQHTVLLLLVPTATLPFAEEPLATTKLVLSRFGHPGPTAGHALGMTTWVAVVVSIRTAFVWLVPPGPVG